MVLFKRQQKWVTAMSKTGEGKPSEEFNNFKEFVRKIVSVPKSEIEAIKEGEQKEKKKTAKKKTVKEKR
jgi:hypothetical protein